MVKKVFEDLCAEAGISPSSVCPKIGITVAAYSQWTDSTIPRNATLKRIADYFNVSIDYLKTGKKTPSAKEELGEQQYALYGEIHDLTEEEAQDILNYIKYKKSQRENK